MITERIEELEELCEEDIEINDVFTYNHKALLERIYAYTIGKYVMCSDPNAIFYNISPDRSHHFAKNIDLDTKDLQPYGVGETNFYQAWIVKMKFNEWMEAEHLAVKLNDLAEKTANQGSHIIKLVEKDGKLTWDNVNLLNIYFDPTVETIRGTDKVEEHYLTEQEIKEKSKIWKHTEELLKTDKNKEGKYEVYEFWGYDEDKYKQIFTFKNGDETKILYETERDEEEDPYYDFHLSTYEGLWLRVGVVQRLFSIQEQVNRLVNYNDANNNISSLLLLRTADPSTQGNVLTGVESGQIINSADLQQIGVSNQYLNEFIAQLQRLEMRADELCYTPQVVRGEQSPSGTPFRSLAVSSNNAKSSFRFIRERIGETLGYVIKEKIIPEVMKDWNKEELFDIAEVQDDILIFNEFYTLFLKQDFRRKKAEVGELVEEGELLKYAQDNLDKLDREGRKVKIPKKFFNFKFGIKFNITGENVDKAQKNGAFESILTWIQTNPQIQLNPYFRQYVEDNGITPIRMRPQELQAPQAPQGGTSRPIPRPIGQGEDKLLGAVDSNE